LAEAGTAPVNRIRRGARTDVLRRRNEDRTAR
jgi:hypothetical protein